MKQNQLSENKNHTQFSEEEKQLLLNILYAEDKTECAIAINDYLHYIGRL